MSDLQGKRFPRQLRMHSGSLVVSIPPQLARKLGWTSGNYLSVMLEGNGISLSRVHLGEHSPYEDKHLPLSNGKNNREFKARKEEKGRIRGE